MGFPIFSLKISKKRQAFFESAGLITNLLEGLVQGVGGDAADGPAEDVALDELEDGDEVLP